jgi:small GTP-binding protein
MLLTYVCGHFPADYVPTVMDDYAANVRVDEEKIVSLGLWDSNGGAEYDRLRPLSYPGASIFLICFSVVTPTSFENAKAKWWQEISQYCPEAAVLLVGTKIDLRDDREMIDKLREKGLKPVTREQGEALAREFRERVSTCTYLECSAWTMIGVPEVFYKVIKTCAVWEVEPKRRGRASCRRERIMTDSSATIEETNAVRLKLGLKPLSVAASSTTTTAATTATAASPSSSALSAAQEEAAMRLAAARRQRLLSGAVHMTKALHAAADGDDDEDDSPAAFIARQRLATQRYEHRASDSDRASAEVRRSVGTFADRVDVCRLKSQADSAAAKAKEKARVVHAEQRAAELSGVQVGHAADKFALGETRILTLADSELLAGDALNDAEDVLVDVTLAEQERREFLQSESKRKRYDVYEAAGTAPSDRAILGFYDERKAGSGSIRLDAAGGFDVNRIEREAMVERQLEAQRSGKILYELSSLKDPVIASDTRAPEEIIADTFKKSGAKKRKKSSSRSTTAELLAEIGVTDDGDAGAAADRGSLAKRERGDDSDDAETAEAVAAARAKRDAYEAAKRKASSAASVRLADPVDDQVGGGGGGGDDDDDDADDQLYAALDRARRAAAAAPPTDVASTVLARQAQREAAQSKAKPQGIVFTETTQFITTLDAQVINDDDDDNNDGDADGDKRAAASSVPKREPKAEVSERSEPAPDMDVDDNDDNDERKPQLDGDRSDHSVFEAQPSLAGGVGSVLSLLRAAGKKALPENIVVGRRGDKRLDLSDDNPSDTARAQTIARLNSGNGRPVPETETRQYNIDLKYTDDKGREVTTKEAYRNLCYKFHNIAPSANQREKYERQRLEEINARKKAENVEETARAFEKMQKKAKKAGTVLKQ